MCSHLRIVGHEWTRYSAYVIERGVIRPGAHATCTRYSPWAEYEASAGATGQRAAEPPYQALLRIAGMPLAGPAQTAAVLEFCTALGLLGLLQHRTVSAALAPRWMHHVTLRAIRGGRDVPAVWHVAQRHYHKIGPMWVSWVVAHPKADAGRQRTLQIIDGALVATDNLTEEFVPAHAVMTPLEPGPVEHVPLGRAWGPYFPAVAKTDEDTYPYPSPLSQDFHAAYGEPVAEFVAAARVVRDALAEIGRLGAGASLTVGEARSATENVLLLDRLLTSVAPASRPVDGRLRMSWSSPSLLGDLALMAMLDVTGGRAVVRCPICGTFFTSAAYQAAYCSTRCRWTAQKRAQRQNARLKAVAAYATNAQARRTPARRARDGRRP